MSTQTQQASLVRNGIWMALEATLSIGSGLLAGSRLLVAFGLDSVIELISLFSQ